MKKITLVSLMSLVFLSLCSGFEVLARNYFFESPWIPLVIGVIILIFSGILSANAKKNIVLNSICFLANAVALGFCIHAWYMYRCYENSIGVMLLVSLACVVYLLIFYLSLYIPFLEKHINVYIWIYLALSLVGYLIVMFNTETTYVSTFGYYMIIEIAFILAMCNHQLTAKHLFRDIVLSTYSVLIVAIIIALIMLGADSLDGLDGIGGDIGPEGGGIKSPRKQRVSTLPIDIDF